MAVPFPFNNPVMVVVSVMAGVIVGVATVPAKPLAVTTLTVVTVPVPVMGAHVLSARRKCVLSAPLLPCTSPFVVDEVLNKSNIAVACAVVRAIGAVALPVLFPIILLAARLAILPRVTAPLAIVTAPVTAIVASPDIATHLFPVAAIASAMKSVASAPTPSLVGALAPLVRISPFWVSKEGLGV